MPPFKDITDQRFERLTVQWPAGIQNRKIRWLCLCICGTLVIVKSDNLITDNTRSCGCLKLEKITHHGHARDFRISREYRTWSGMIQRCTNPNNQAWANYGGRGILVCPQWLDSFENFFQDMGRKPIGLTLERKDNDGNYDPENCCWASHVEQQRNRREYKKRSF